ncbi:MAG: Glycosyltransferase [Candidatus Moranbacteria bacterium GW2011_GWA2_39_41]|nr:MAG: Glycosyltransferase [Candidatus Moranbacteria bacterium GW2011_GWA2_39_41]
MKIAFIGQKGIPMRSGGVENRVEELSVRLAKKHEVFVYVRNNYTDKNLHEYKGVKLIHLPSISTKNLDAISHTFLATMHALFQNYDIINYQAPGPSTLAWIIRLFKRKTAVVGTFNSIDCMHKKWGWFARKYLQFGEYAVSKFPNKTIAVTPIIKEYMKEKFAAEGTVVLNGAGVEYTEADNLLAEWGLQKKKYFIYVGRLVRHKGVHYLIEAFQKLIVEKKIPADMKLAIVGDSAYTDEYVASLKAMSAGWDNIIFTGTQFGEKLKQLFSHAYLFVQPSEAEGLSMALLDAMGCGLAPLVSDIKENLDPTADCGFAFKNMDVIDLADKMQYLVENPQMVEARALLAKKNMNEKYNWDKSAEETEAVYQEAINSKLNIA